MKRIGFMYIPMANTFFTKKFTCLAVGTLCQASKVHHRPMYSSFLIQRSKVKYNCLSVPEQNLGFRLQNDLTRKMNMAFYASVPSRNSLPVNSSPGNWKVWIIGGTIIIILLSFTKGRWGTLLQFKEKIETTIDEAEWVADIVEEVAEGVEKVAEGAIQHLPKGKLHDAAELVEKVAKDIDKHAQNAEDVLEKVEDMEKEVDSFFESTTRHVTTDSKDHK